MLERIKLENFKCFKSQEIPLGSISILANPPKAKPLSL